MIRLLIRTLPLVITLGAYSGSAVADNKTLDDYLILSLAELGQIKVSIATGNGTVLDKAPATASVIYAAEIEAMGARTLDDILETVPGFHVSLSPISRIDSVYSIRGIHTGFSPQVLLLLDGLAVQSVQGSKPALFRLPVAGIERVEVIRGPGSAIYGADAFSGVINVITKGAQALDTAQIGARTGSFNSQDMWAQGATQWQGWDIAFSTNYQETDGDDSRRVSADLQTRLNAVYGSSVKSYAPGPLATRYQIVDNHLSFSSEQFAIKLWQWRSTDAGTGAGAAQALDPDGRDDSNIWMADMTYHLPHLSDYWSSDIQLSHQHLQSKAQFNVLPAGTVVDIGSDGNLGSSPVAGRVTFPDGLLGNPEYVAIDEIVDFNSTYSGWDSHRIRIALGARHVAADTEETKNFGPGVIDGTEGVRDGTLVDVSDNANVYMSNESRSIRYISLQDEWQLNKKLALTSGLRYDHYSDFGSTTNPRLGLVWSAVQDATVKLLYGSAFRAPSFQELYFQNNPISLGNGSLKPERMDTLELAVNYRITPEFQSTLTLFNYQAQDLIEFTPDAGAPTNTAQNARDQRAMGAEWELSWRPSAALRLVASYSWQDACDVQTNMTIAAAPAQQIKANANWGLAHNWFLNGQVYYVADRARAAGDDRAQIADYTLAHATLLRKNIFRNLDLSLSLRNLADVKAREPSNGIITEDYPLEGRSAWLGFRYFL